MFNPESGTIPDGLVISSGIHRDSGGWRGFNTTEEDWDTVMNINLKVYKIYFAYDIYFIYKERFYV